MSTEFMQMIC